MESSQPTSTAATKLASQLEGVIRERGLGPGDRFLTAAEVGRLFGVSTATAHRSMARLVSEGVLERFPNRGTFVGRRFRVDPPTRLKVIHHIGPPRDRVTADFPFDILVSALQRHFGHVSVQINFLPKGNPLSFVKELLRPNREAGELLGVMPSSLPRDVYRWLSDEGLPMVIFGSPYPGQDDLAAVDIDFAQSGYLMARYAAEAGHRRMALIGRLSGFPGENSLFDGITRGLTEASLSPSSLLMRTVPDDIEAFSAQIRDLLNMPEPPTAILATKRLFAQAALSILQSMDAAKRLEVVCVDGTVSREKPLPCASVRPEMPFDAIVDAAAAMLVKQVQGEQLEQHRVVVPVALQKNGETAKAPDQVGKLFAS